MRFFTCSVCGRQGRRYKFFVSRGSLPVCRDEEICYQHFQFKQRIEAMPSPEEERELVRAEVAVRMAEIMGELQR